MLGVMNVETYPKFITLPPAVFEMCIGHICPMIHWGLFDKI